MSNWNCGNNHVTAVYNVTPPAGPRFKSILSWFTEQATQGQTTLVVVTGGIVKFEGNKQRFFNQNFLLTAQASTNNDQPVWKIASDCFRFQDWNSWDHHSPCFVHSHLKLGKKSFCSKIMTPQLPFTKVYFRNVEGKWKMV